MKTFKESFYDIAKTKNSWVELSKQPHEPIAKRDMPLKKNLFDLVSLSYQASLGEPHFGVKSPNDILGAKYDFWKAIDLDENPDANAVIFGRQNHGIKIGGIGHDGEKISKSVIVNGLVKLLSEPGYWTEASDPVSPILKAKGAPILKDKMKIQSLFPDAKILQWNDDGSYVRQINDRGETSQEFIFGNPQ